MSERENREELCPDCLAFPGEHDQRVITGSLNGSTTVTWHKNDCPSYGVPARVVLDNSTATFTPTEPPRPHYPDEEPTP